MQVKKYIAQDMAEAVQMIKEEMGPRAVILSTRKIRKGSGAFGLFGKYVLEVTAARDEKAAVAKSAARPAPVPPPAPAQPPMTSGKPPGMTEYEWEITQNAPREPRRAAPLNLKGNNQMQEEISELKELIQELRKGARKEANEQANVSHLRYELNELKHMVGDLINQSSGIKDLHLHENLMALYQQLTFNGVEEKFAKKLCEEVQKKIPQTELDNFSYVKVYLARMFMQVINILETPLPLQPGKPKVVALLGATGVGKTTTLAKLAAAEKLRNKNIKLGLITVDTYRIAAVAQLKEYAKILKVPCKVVHDAAELNQALADYKDMDMVLLDTAGRSQRDATQMNELKEFLVSHEDFTNLLVLGATTKDQDLVEMTKRFSLVPIHGVIFTKLDESTSYGSIFNHAIRFKLPLAWLTTGQNVPEDIEPASRERLVDLLLNISGELEAANA